MIIASLTSLVERLVGGLLGTVLGPDGATFWMPREASTVARGVDWVFDFILGISVFFFVLIVALMVVFLIKYRRRPGRTEPDPAPTHNMPLELTWTGIPIIIVIAIFFFGFKGFLDMTTPPANAYQVQVNAQKWNWSFTYPNGYVDSDLHVPVDRPIELVMSSQDVIHSFYVPAFRLKRDVVPGRYAKLWFQATEPGEYQVFCAEYCGRGHSDMLAHVVVHPAGEFHTWLDNASNLLATMSPVDAGRKLYETRGCAQCHSIDGSGRVGPSFKGIFGEQQVLSTGARVTVDENYVRESILEPQAKVVAGFDPVMPTYQGRLKNDEINAIIAYLKSLSGHGSERSAKKE